MWRRLINKKRNAKKHQYPTFPDIFQLHSHAQREVCGAIETDHNNFHFSTQAQRRDACTPDLDQNLKKKKK